ncbi:MAG TPA: phenylacetate--CoA ligase family protein, partial [Burkholderiales bacterium]
MSKYYDDLETRSAEVRERALLRALQEQIDNAKKNAPYFARLLQDVQPSDVKDRAALARLPVTRKSELIELQERDRPFAGMTAVPLALLGRVFASPGPIYDPQADTRDYWGMARALYA